MKTLIVIFILLSVYPSYARLGETEAQIEARYGKVISVKAGDTTRDTKNAYYHNGIYITVVFLDGKSSCEGYCKAYLSSTEIQALLDVNSLGHTWKKRSKLVRGLDLEYWELSNLFKTYAIASVTNQYTTYATLTIQSNEYGNLKAKLEDENIRKRDAEAVKPLKDF